MATPKESDPKTVIGAVNLLYETLEPFTPDQRSQVMRAVAGLLGVKSTGQAAPGRTDPTKPAPQGGQRRG